MINFNISGCSDDLIEIDGDLCEELYADHTPDYYSEDAMYVYVYDGTVLSVVYNGDWHFRCVCVGYAFDHIEPFKPGGDEYSDKVYFTDTKETQILKWVGLGEKLANL